MIEHIEQGTLPAHIKACIALTSWKKRINTVGLTIYNLFETCGPDYHIVLTLAEEEFPKKEQELPRDLVLMNKAGVFEILWVKKNYKSFKKWLFCSARFSKVPVITADDDCIYIRNYADELYKMWHAHQDMIVTNSPGMKYGITWPNGPYTIYPPRCFSKVAIGLLDNKKILNTNNDDAFYGCLAHKLHLNIIGLYKDPPIIFHDNVCGLGDGENAYDAKSDIATITGELK
jgi:hypothetical protein